MRARYNKIYCRNKRLLSRELKGSGGQYSSRDSQPNDLGYANLF